MNLDKTIFVEKIRRNLPNIHKIMMLALLGPGHVRVESSNCRFPRELVSFVRPREIGLFSFGVNRISDPRSLRSRIRRLL